MAVRAKFNCTSIDDNGVRLNAVVANSTENEAFFAATPNGEVRLSILNPAAAEQFEVGRSYYLDFTPAD